MKTTAFILFIIFSISSLLQAFWINDLADKTRQEIYSNATLEEKEEYNNIIKYSPIADLTARIVTLIILFYIIFHFIPFIYSKVNKKMDYQEYKKKWYF